MSETFILSFDPASTNPSISICTSLDSPNKQVCTSSLLSNLSTNSTNSKVQKYDSALFLNRIFELCEQVNCKPVQISKLALCTGPGSFSPLRVGSIIARILYRLNPQLELYRFNLLYLLAKKYKLENLVQTSTNVFYLQASTNSYFMGDFSDDSLKVELVQEMFVPGTLIEKEYKFNLSELMIESLYDPGSKKFLVQNLQEIIPDYFREPSVTVKKS